MTEAQVVKDQPEVAGDHRPLPGKNLRALPGLGVRRGEKIRGGDVSSPRYGRDIHVRRSDFRDPPSDSVKS
jgi:hypothetical protein